MTIIKKDVFVYIVIGILSFVVFSAGISTAFADVRNVNWQEAKQKIGCDSEKACREKYNALDVTTLAGVNGLKGMWDFFNTQGAYTPAEQKILSTTKDIILTQLTSAKSQEEFDDALLMAAEDILKNRALAGKYGISQKEVRKMEQAQKSDDALQEAMKEFNCGGGDTEKCGQDFENAIAGGGDTSRFKKIAELADKIAGNKSDNPDSYLNQFKQMQKRTDEYVQVLMSPSDKSDIMYRPTNTSKMNMEDMLMFCNNAPNPAECRRGIERSFGVVNTDTNQPYPLIPRDHSGDYVQGDVIRRPGDTQMYDNSRGGMVNECIANKTRYTSSRSIEEITRTCENQVDDYFKTNPQRPPSTSPLAEPNYRCPLTARAPLPIGRDDCSYVKTSYINYGGVLCEGEKVVCSKDTPLTFPKIDYPSYPTITTPSQKLACINQNESSIGDLNSGIARGFVRGEPRMAFAVAPTISDAGDSALSSCGLSSGMLGIVRISSWPQDMGSKIIFPISFRGGSIANNRAEASSICAGMSPGSGGPSDPRYTSDQVVCVNKLGLSWGGGNYGNTTQPSEGMGVSATWTFKDGSTQWSSILSRIDREYTDFIASKKAEAFIGYFNGWEPGGGNQSIWREFGIPKISATPVASTPYSSYNSCGIGRYSEFTIPMPEVEFNAPGIRQGTCFKPGMTEYADVNGMLKLCSTVSILGCVGNTSTYSGYGTSNYGDICNKYMSILSGSHLHGGVCVASDEQRWIPNTALVDSSLIKDACTSTVPSGVAVSCPSTPYTMPYTGTSGYSSTACTAERPYRWSGDTTGLCITASECSQGMGTVSGGTMCTPPSGPTPYTPPYLGTSGMSPAPASCQSSPTQYWNGYSCITYSTPTTGLYTPPPPPPYPTGTYSSDPATAFGMTAGGMASTMPPEGCPAGQYRDSTNACVNNPISSTMTPDDGCKQTYGTTASWNGSKCIGGTSPTASVIDTLRFWFSRP